MKYPRTWRELSTPPAEDERFEREAPNVDEALARSFKRCVSFYDEPALARAELRWYLLGGYGITVSRENTRMAPSSKWHLKTKTDGSKKARIVVHFRRSGATSESLCSERIVLHTWKISSETRAHTESGKASCTVQHIITLILFLDRISSSAADSFEFFVTTRTSRTPRAPNTTHHTARWRNTPNVSSVQSECQSGKIQTSAGFQRD